MRYFLGLLLGVGLIVVVFILILRAFGGNAPKVEVDLTDYAFTNTVVRLTMEGRVNADQNHQVVTVTVGREDNAVNVIRGYEGRIVKTKNYNNNESAYGTFLRALQLQGYNRGDDDPNKEDSRGVCPTGRVYIFEIITGSDIVQKYWTTTCGGGTFQGNTTTIRTLFREQIPDFGEFTRGTGLN